MHDKKWKSPHWAYVVGLIITVGGGITASTQITAWIWNIFASPVVQRQIESTFKPHCEEQKKKDSEIVAKIDNLRVQVQTNQEEMRVTNAEIKTMLKTLIRKSN